MSHEIKVRQPKISTYKLLENDCDYNVVKHTYNSALGMHDLGFKVFFVRHNCVYTIKNVCD